jgi:hypothetical protein
VQYGEVYTILLFGRRMTYFITPEAADAFFNARHEDVSAELAYAPITVPVFGKDVVYDVPYAVLVEQKKCVPRRAPLCMRVCVCVCVCVCVRASRLSMMRDVWALWGATNRMIKSNLTPEMFRAYVPRIELEVAAYTK